MLFKALVLVLQTTSTNPAAVEIGPFSSHAQCMQAAQEIMAPAARSAKTEGSTRSGISSLVYPGGYERKDFAMGVQITCYEIAS